MSAGHAMDCPQADGVPMRCTCGRGDDPATSVAAIQDAIEFLFVEGRCPGLRLRLAQAVDDTVALGRELQQAYSDLDASERAQATFREGVAAAEARAARAEAALHDADRLMVAHLGPGEARRYSEWRARHRDACLDAARWSLALDTSPARAHDPAEPSHIQPPPDRQPDYGNDPHQRGGGAYRSWER